MSLIENDETEAVGDDGYRKNPHRHCLRASPPRSEVKLEGLKDLPTVACLILMPSLSSSPWMRGAPQRVGHRSEPRLRPTIDSGTAAIERCKPTEATSRM